MKNGEIVYFIENKVLREAQIDSKHKNFEYGNNPRNNHINTEVYNVNLAYNTGVKSLVTMPRNLFYTKDELIYLKEQIDLHIKGYNIVKEDF